MGKIKETNKFGYLAVYTKDKDVDVIGGVVKNEDVVFDLDGKRFTGTSVGQIYDGWHGASVKSNNPDFDTALAKSYILTVNPDGDNPIKISLDGTFKAMAETQACNQRLATPDCQPNRERCPQVRAGSVKQQSSPVRAGGGISRGM